MTNLNDKKIKISVNKFVIGKDKEAIRYNNNKFINQELTIQEIANLINKGYATYYYIKGYNIERNSSNFDCCDIIWIDIDNGMTIEEAKENDFIKKFASIFYTTSNHTPQQHRFRIGFVLPQTIDNYFMAKKTIKGLLKKFPMADKSCSDLARIFFGSINSNPEILGNMLDEETVKELQELGTEHVQNSDDVEGKSYNQISENEIIDMLSYIPKQLEYEQWRNIVWAITNHLKGEGKSIIENWSPDIKDKGKHLDRLIRDNKGKIKIGTLVYYAKQYGYKLPICYATKKRKAGQVALEDLFNNGYEYITVVGEVYQYQKGRYIKQDDNVLLQRINQYFNTYQTSEDETAYASSSSVNTALEYVKQNTSVSTEKLNPPGINTLKGYLRIVYNEKNIPEFKLEEHSPDLYFTYIADFEPDLNCDCTEFNKIMDDILDREQQKILFANLGASLDLQKVRQTQSRITKTLLLLGEGANGKDTLRSWVSKLYGDFGLTIVSLQAFKSADSGKLFSLHSLANSKVNWPSESVSIIIDNCQTLKSFSTGDEIQLEKKHKDSYSYKPNAIALFNLNDRPKFSTNRQAIISRYYVLTFNSVFCKNPDPNKSWEKKARAEIKDDNEFIKKNILPALLNRMLEGLKDSLSGNVDYSVNEKLMEELLQETNHLNEFIAEYGIEECDLSEGIKVRDLYNIYRLWCLREGLMEECTYGNSENFSIRYNHPSNTDKVITNERQLPKFLKKIFTRLQSKRNAYGSILGLKITKNLNKMGNY